MACTVVDNAKSGAVLNCSSMPLSPREVGLSLDDLTDGGVGVPHPFVLGTSMSGSNYSITLGPDLNSGTAPSLSLNVLSLPQYVIGASVCEPQSTLSWSLNGTVLDFEECELSPSSTRAITRFNVIVSLVHVDEPPYFTIPPLNITASAVGVIGSPIWIPLSTVVVNPDPVHPYSLTSFVLQRGPCSSPAGVVSLPFAIGSLNGSIVYSVNGSLGGWPSPVRLCVLAVDGGLLNATLDVTVWLAPVAGQLLVAPSSLNMTHYSPGVSNASVSVLFSPGSHTNVSWTVQASAASWLTIAGSATTSSSILFVFNSTGLAAFASPTYQTVIMVSSTGKGTSYTVHFRRLYSVSFQSQTTRSSRMFLSR